MAGFITEYIRLRQTSHYEGRMGEKMSTKKRTVDIVLPVYNGEKYVKEQIESILCQTYPYWRLLIRDDGSTDNTVAIIMKYLLKYPDKILMIEDDKRNLGVTNNSFEICRHVQSDYIMFCDQDDVWFEDKVEQLLKYMVKAEQKYGAIPLLVHSDAVVVDSKLKVINRSFTELAGFNRAMSHLSNLLQFNIVQGSTSIFNRVLLDKLLRLSDAGKVNKKTYHDWWCALIAAAFGKIIFCNRQLMLYRQHGKNLVGVGYFKKKTLKELFHDKGTELKITNYCKVNRMMCRKFLDYYSKDLSEKQIKIVEHYYQRPDDVLEFFTLGLYREYKLRDMLFMFLFGIE
jgi:glycosyltransferase involved in cell wall biosynthesis